MENDIIELENRCIHNVEVAFHEFLLEDLGDAGEVEDLIGDLDWYLFWLAQASDIIWRINYMLGSNYDRGLLLRAIAIKRVIDQNIIKYASIDEIRKDLGLGGRTEVKQLIQLNIGNDKVEEFLNAFYIKLKSEGFIDSSFKDLTTNFIRCDTVIPINWIGKQNFLLGLIKFFIRKNTIILPKNRTVSHIIATHFVRNNKPLNKRSVEVALTDVKENDKEYSIFIELTQFNN